VSWGLLSTARINDAILAGAAESDAVEVVAVGSRDAARARAYADEHGIARAHGSYDELLADPDVDAVYVSLPNGLHVEWTIRALEAGKHVLCEKPFDRRVSEVERAFDVAEARGLVLSEAFMWRHHPQTRKLVELLERVAPVKLVRATFSFPLDRPGDVRWRPELDGGSLMDVGCYCVSGIRLVLGEPSDVRGLAVGDGVDRNFAGAMRFASGALATFDCGFDLPPRDSLEVIGDGGTLFLADPWHARAPGILVNGEVVEVERANSYRLELEDVSAAISEGRPPLLGREDAVGQARVLQALLEGDSPLNIKGTVPFTIGGQSG
jgi:xylose dehydrogenase (NAD/NADP)